MNEVNKYIERKLFVFLILVLVIFIVMYFIVTNDNYYSKVDVSLENVKVVEGSVVSDIPVVKNGKEVSFNTSILKPNDFYKFSIDFINKSSDYIVIEDIITNEVFSGKQEEYFDYSISYDNGDVNKEQIIRPGKGLKINVSLEYNDDLEVIELDKDVNNLDLSFEVDYEKIYDTPDIEMRYDGNYNIIEGDGSSIGSRVSIGDEIFRVLNSNGVEVTLLAEKAIDVVLNKQSNDVLGTYDENSFNKYHLIKFSDNRYWHSDKIKYKDPYIYLYDDNSSLFSYIENYKNYLESFNIKVKDARLINWNELKLFNCDSKTKLCLNDFEWFNSKQCWWSGVAYSSLDIWNINSNGNIGYNIYHSSCGIRPVIIISSSSI